MFPFSKNKNAGRNKEEIPTHPIWTFRCATTPSSARALFGRRAGLGRKELMRHHRPRESSPGRICSNLTHVTRWEREAGNVVHSWEPVGLGMECTGAGPDAPGLEGYRGSSEARVPSGLACHSAGPPNASGDATVRRMHAGAGRRVLSVSFPEVVPALLHSMSFICAF